MFDLTASEQALVALVQRSSVSSSCPNCSEVSNLFIIAIFILRVLVYFCLLSEDTVFVRSVFTLTVLLYLRTFNNQYVIDCNVKLSSVVLGIGTSAKH